MQGQFMDFPTNEGEKTGYVLDRVLYGYRRYRKDRKGTARRVPFGK